MGKVVRSNPFVLSDDEIRSVPTKKAPAAAAAAAPKAASNPFVLDDEEIAAVPEKKSAGGNASGEISAPTVSNTEPIDPTVQTPSAVPGAPPQSKSPGALLNTPARNLERDIDDQFKTPIDYQRYFAEPIPKLENEAAAAKVKQAVFTDPKALTGYLRARGDDIAGQMKQVEEMKYRPTTGDRFLSPSTREALKVKNKVLDGELAELKKKQNDLSQNALGVATDMVVSKLDLKSFNPDEVGRSLIEISNPHFNDQIKMVEKGGNILPGIQKADMERTALNAIKSYIVNNPNAPDAKTGLAIVESYESDFDERNKELAIATVREKIGAQNYREGYSGFFGNSQDRLNDVVSNPMTGLTPSEMKVARESVLPLEKKIFGTNIPGSGFGRSFRNAFEKSINSSNNTIAGLFGVRDDSDRATDMLNDEMTGSRFRAAGEGPRGLAQLEQLRELEKTQPLTANQKFQKTELEKYVDVRSNWGKVLDGMGDLTGQVAYMALGAKGMGIVGGAAPGVVGTALGSNTAGLVVNTFLNTYDNYRTSAIEIMPGEDQAAERNAYAVTMTGVEMLTERIFPDTKVLGSFMGKIAPSVQDISQRFINKEISQQVAKAEIAGTVKQYLKTFGKEFATSVGQNATEEATVDIADGIASSVYGGQSFDMAKTGKQALNTFLTTALYSPIVAGAAGHGAYRNQTSQNAFFKSALVNMGTNPGEYLRSVEDLQTAGIITQDEANEKIKLVKSAHSYLKELPGSRPIAVTESGVTEMTPFDFPETSSYLLHRMNEGIVTEKMNNTSDPIEKAALQKELDRSIAIRKGIYDGKIGVTPDIVDVTEDAELAEELGIAPAMEVEPNDLVGTRITQPEPGVSEVEVDDVDAASLKADLSKMDLTGKGVIAGMQGNGPELLNFIQEQATGLTSDRSTVNAPAIDNVIETFGEDAVYGAVSVMTPDDKQFVKEMWESEGIEVPPLLKDLFETPKAAAETVKAAPEDSISVSEMIGKTGTYKGQKGKFSQDGQQVIFQVDGSNREYELGNADELSNTSISSFGIDQDQSVVSSTEDGKVSVRGVNFVNNFSDPYQAINRDKNGNVKSVTLETEDGKKRTFRGQVAQDVAYEITLQEINKNNEQAAVEQFINEEPAVAEEINNGRSESVAEVETTPNTEEVSRTKIEQVTEPVAEESTESEVENEDIENVEFVRLPEPVSDFEAVETVASAFIDLSQYKTKEQIKISTPGFGPVRLIGDPDLIELIDIGAKKHRNTAGRGKSTIDPTRQKELEEKFGISATKAFGRAQRIAQKQRLPDAEKTVFIGKPALPQEVLDKNKKITYGQFEKQIMEEVLATDNNAGNFIIPIGILGTMEKEKAIKDIKAGRNTRVAREMKRVIREMYENRNVVVRTSGGGLETSYTEIPIDEWAFANLTPEEMRKGSLIPDDVAKEVAQMIADEGITLENIDEIQSRLGGLIYEDTDFAAAKAYLAGSVPGNESAQKTNERDQAETTQEAKAPVESKTTETRQAETVVTPPNNIVPAAKALADKLRKLKISSNNTLQSNILGIPIAVYDSALELIATAIEGGAVLADAIAKGIAEIRKSNPQNFDEAGFIKQINDALGEETTSPPADPTATTRSDIPGMESLGNEDGRTRKRNFTQRAVTDRTLTPEAVADIAENMEYLVQANVVSIQKANEIIENIGVDEAYKVVTGMPEMNGAVRVVMGIQLIDKFNKLALDAEDDAVRNHYIDQTVAITDFVGEKLGTSAGQAIQAFSLYAKLSPEAQVRKAIKDQKRQAKPKKEKAQKPAKKITEQLNKINEETAKEITEKPETKKKITEKKSSTVEKAKDKIEKARQKREELIKKRKDDKGKGGALYSSPGLTKEGIEFVGNIAKTYFDEGVAQLSIVVDNVIRDIQDLSGKQPTAEVIADVNSIVRAQYDKIADKRLASGLKQMEKEIGQIIRDHYTVSETQKRSLIDKLVQDAGLDQQDAEDLAKTVETEFDEIATRKKRDILDKEKKRFDRVNKKLAGSKKPSKMEIQDQFIKYSNLGALGDADMVDFLASKLGTGQLAPEQVKEIGDLAKKVQSAKEGSPKTRAIEALLKYQADMKGTNWLEISQAIWYANVLSGWGTQFKNFVSTFANGFLHAAAVAMQNPLNIPALMVGGAKGFVKGGAEFWNTVSTGESPIHYSRVELPDVLERKRFIGGWLNPYNYLKFVSRVMKASDGFFFQALKEARITQMAYTMAKKEGFKNPFGKDTWAKINETLLDTPDRLEDAQQEAMDEGLEKNSFKYYRRVTELMELSRPVEMTEEAYGFAAKGTFNHDTQGTLGWLTDAVGVPLSWQPVKGFRPLGFVVPFTKILTNVVNNAIDFTPLGLARAVRGKRGFAAYEDSRFKGKYHEMSDDERAQTYAKVAIGIGLTTALIAMSKMNGDDDKPIIEITGAGTGDYKKDAQLKESGWQPYSIKVGGKYYSYALTPLIFNLGWVGSMNDLEKYKSMGEDEMAKKVALTAWHEIKMMSDMTWIGSTGTLLSAMNSDNPEALAKNIQGTLSNSGKSFLIPNIYSQSAQRVQNWMQMPQKQTNDAYERLIQDIPVARDRLFNKVNALGDPIVRDVDIIVSNQTTDPVFKFLLDKNAWVAPVDKKSLLKFDPKLKEDRPVTDDEFYQFSKSRGSKIKEKLQDVIANGAMIDSDGEVTVLPKEEVGRKPAKSLTTQEVKKIIKSAATSATKKAKKELIFDEPTKSKSEPYSAF
jgi:hypothetical protein